MSIKQIVSGLALWLLLLAGIIALPFIPFSSSKPIQAEFLQQTHHNKAIVFFGFPQCHGVCPATMATLKQWYNSAITPPQVATFFVNIDPKGNLATTQAYTSGFNPNFIGLYPTPNELSQLTHQFGLNVQESKGSIDHRGRTYLLEKQKNDWVLASTINPQGLSVATLNQLL